MPGLYYKDALRLGQKECRARVSAGESPYLPALDDMISAERAISGLDLGIVSIPTEYIVGTKTNGRTNAFARNFMPLLEENTEFAYKWERLCKSHLEEGIRDSIKVYEYLNRYYVQEGNKRVSVMKFFDAVSIPAQVIRIMPEDGDTEEAQLYMEFVAFNRISGINYPEFSRRGSYARLQAIVGKAADEPWTDEDRSKFLAAYHRFKQAYESVGKARPATSAADAMLSYMEVYGYGNLCESGQAELKKAIARIWEEVKLQQESSPIELKTEPAGEKKQSLLSKVIPTSRMAKVAFIYDKSPLDSAWAYGHDQGRQYVQQAFKGKIETNPYCDSMVNGAQQTVEQAISDGNKVIFTTSPRLLSASFQAAIEHPDVMVFNCALNQSHRYICTYYPRVYEAKYIVGAIAGAMAGGEDVGYVCDYPIYGQIAGINAFALGVQLVNPRAKVVLEWSSVDGYDAARRKLEERGIRLISSQDLSRQDDGSFGVHGLVQSDGLTSRMLAAPLWKWDVYYEEMVRRILNKTLRDEYVSSKKALNYYWGMSAGVVDVLWSPELPEGVQKLAGYLKQGICREVCNPFILPVRNQSGQAVPADGHALGLEQIMEMDYLVENVIGTIPSYDELKTFSKATVDVMGVKPSTKDGAGKAPEEVRRI